MTDIEVTHIGGPTVLIEFDGWRILTDPTFDAPGRRYTFGWGSASRKATGPSIDPADLGRIDAVLLSHDHHADNLDDAGRALLPTAGRVLTTVAGAKRLGGNAIGIAPWATTQLTADNKIPLDVTATPCRHGPAGSRPITGDVIGFALRWDGQQHGELWMSGDTVLYPGVQQVPQRLRVGTALLHLGSVRFTVTGPVRYSMTAAEAVELGEQLRPTTVIPVHYEGWSHFRQQRAAIESEFAKAPPAFRDTVRWAPIGEPMTVTV